MDLCVEELAPFGEDPRAPKWRAGDVATQKVASGADPLPAKDEEQLGVVVIGAGMSGILSAIRLKQAVIPFVVLEKNNTVAGTWAENIYPHARVDSSNLFYSYTFAQRLNWPKLWSPQPTLLEYFDAVADKFDIKKYIRFGEEVLESVWDESRNVWEVRTAKGQKWTTRAIITCVGGFFRPVPSLFSWD